MSSKLTRSERARRAVRARQDLSRARHDHAVRGYKKITTDAGVVEWKIPPLAYESLTETTLAERRDDDMLLGIKAELFMADDVIRLCLRKKGMTDKEIKEWARAQI